MSKRKKGAVEHLITAVVGSSGCSSDRFVALPDLVSTYEAFEHVKTWAFDEERGELSWTTEQVTLDTRESAKVAALEAWERELKMRGADAEALKKEVAELNETALDRDLTDEEVNTLKLKTHCYRNHVARINEMSERKEPIEARAEIKTGVHSYKVQLGRILELEHGTRVRFVRVPEEARAVPLKRARVSAEEKQETLTLRVPLHSGRPWQRDVRRVWFASKRRGTICLSLETLEHRRFQSDKPSILVAKGSAGYGQPFAAMHEFDDSPDIAVFDIDTTTGSLFFRRTIAGPLPMNHGGSSRVCAFTGAGAWYAAVRIGGGVRVGIIKDISEASNFQPITTIRDLAVNGSARLFVRSIVVTLDGKFCIAIITGAHRFKPVLHCWRLSDGENLRVSLRGGDGDMMPLTHSAWSLELIEVNFKPFLIVAQEVRGIAAARFDISGNECVFHSVTVLDVPKEIVDPTEVMFAPSFNNLLVVMDSIANVWLVDAVATNEGQLSLKTRTIIELCKDAALMHMVGCP